MRKLLFNIRFYSIVAREWIYDRIILNTIAFILTVLTFLVFPFIVIYNFLFKKDEL